MITKSTECDHHVLENVPARMAAAVIVQPGLVDLIEVPVPHFKSNQALIHIEACGVCASNLPRWEGRSWFPYPTKPGELGHEGCGRIVEMGQGVSGWRVGERVAFLSNKAYAQYDVANAGEMVRVPEEFGCLPGEPLACAWNIFRRSGIEAGHEVAIIGGGFLAVLLAQLALYAGAQVVVVSRRPFDQSVMAVLGSAEVVTLGHGMSADDLAGRFYDVVIEATGKQAPLDLAAQLIRERGRLVIAGYHQDGPRQVNMQLWNWLGLDVINAHERDPAIYVDGMRCAFSAMRKGALNPEPLLTHHLPLDRLADAFELARLRPEGFMKAIVHP